MRVSLIAILTQALLLTPGFAATAMESDEVDLPALEITIAPVETLLTTADEYAFELTLENTGDTPLEAGETRFHIGEEPVATAQELLTPDTPDLSSSTPVEAIETPVLAPDERFEVTFVVSARDFPLSFNALPGVYLTQADWGTTEMLQGEQSVAVPTSPLVWQAERIDTTLDLASAIPVVFPDDEGTPTLPQQVNTALESHPELLTLVDTAVEHGALLGIDPRFHAYTGALGGAASEASREIGAALTDPSLASFPLQFADADPVITSHYGDEESPLEPLGLSFLTAFHSSLSELVESDYAHRDELLGEGSPDEGPVDPDSIAPPIDELLNWDTSYTGVAWPAPDSLSPSTIVELENRGFDTVIASGSHVTGSPRGTVGKSTVLHSNQHLEQATRELLTAHSDAETKVASAKFDALTAVLGMQSTPVDHAQVFLAFDRELAAEPEHVSTFFAHLSELPWMSTVPVNELREGAVTVEEHPGETAHIFELQTAIENEAEVVGYARVLEEPQLLIDYERDRLLRLFAVHEETEEERTERITEHLEGDAELLAGVSLVNTENTRLLGTTSRIPVQLRNTLPFAAKVEGVALPGSAAISVPHPRIEPTVIPAESTINAIITVQSRLSSGQSTLVVNLVDTHEQTSVTSHVFDLTLSGDTEVVALTMLGVIVTALFAGGLWRSWRRRRQRGLHNTITDDTGDGNSERIGLL